MSKLKQGPNLKYSSKIGLGEFFFQSAERFEEQIFQIDAIADTRESYSILKLRSTKIALELQKRGITDKDVIVFCNKVSIDELIAMMACFYLGTKIATLNTSFSIEYTSKLLNLVNPTLIFVETDNVLLIEKSLKISRIQADIIVFGQSIKYPTFSFLETSNQTEENNKEAKKFKPSKPKLQDTAVIYFKKDDGKNEAPNAVCHSHSSFLNAVNSLYQSGCNCETLLCPVTFDEISALILVSSLFLSGGQRVFCPFDDSENLFRVIEKYEVTHLFLTAEMSYKFDKATQFNISCLDYILLTGSRISPERLKTLREIFKNSQITFAYGLKEAGIVTVFNLKRDERLMRKKLDSTGKPSAGVTIKVVDPKNHKTLESGEKGEIYVKSPALMKGYFNSDHSTLFDKDGFLKTGDMGLFDEDDCFYIVDKLQ